MGQFDRVTEGPQWSPDSHYMKEMKKWDTPKRQGGNRCDGYERYPAMLYRARKPEGGGPYIVIDPRDEKWSAGNTVTVGNEREEQAKLSEGWRKSPEEAIEYAKGLDKDIANAAAERHFSDRKMSEAAQREAAEADAETAEHLPEIPAKRKRK